MEKKKIILDGNQHPCAWCRINITDLGWYQNKMVIDEDGREYCSAYCLHQLLKNEAIVRKVRSKWGFSDSET